MTIIQLGNAGNEAIAAHDYAAAEDDFNQVIITMFNTNAIDARALAKAVLGLLICFIKTDDIETAHAVWTANAQSEQEQNPYAYGIKFIESGQTDANDFAIYLMLSSLLYAHAKNPDKGALAEIIARSMTMVLDHAGKPESKNPAVLKTAANNWLHCLQVLYGPEANAIPQIQIDAIQAYDGNLDVHRPVIFNIPALSPWTEDNHPQTASEL
ncbi:MAG: hypothetical protein K2X70_08755 [Candidatus Obscuribacterales bacterium]|nr:hypothetical protein [Candidatus Obscuribacterales bacterium]